LFCWAYGDVNGKMKLIAALDNNKQKNNIYWLISSLRRPSIRIIGAFPLAKRLCG